MNNPLEQYINKMKRFDQVMRAGISNKKSHFVANGVEFSDSEEEAVLAEKSKNVRLGQPISLDETKIEEEIDKIALKIIEDTLDDAL